MTSDAVVEVNRGRSKHFILTRSICQGCLLLLLLCILVIELFLYKPKENLRRITMLVTNNADTEETSKEIWLYEIVAVAKINCWLTVQPIEISLSPAP